MLKHIKLTTIRWIFALLLLLACTIIGLGTLSLKRHITLIDTTWHQFQTDRSEKARLESVLRVAIGYGGMIHEFKNYLLRQEPASMDRIQANIGAARSVLRQYRDLELSEAEIVALDDIMSVLNRYNTALIQAEQMISNDISINEIDNTVRINDEPALRGLQVLRTEVRKALGSESQLSKARISADLRASLGYGGMIHEFKNYVLRHDQLRLAKIHHHLDLACKAIDQYHRLGTTQAEKLALDDIDAVLDNYDNNLKVVTDLIGQGYKNHQIDHKVRIDDMPALRGLSILDRENRRQVANRNNSVSRALTVVNNNLEPSVWGIIILLFLVALFAQWLIQRHIIWPILQLTQNMVRLADNDFSVKLDNYHSDNELGEMAQTVMVFRENMIERDKGEKLLAKANKDTNMQLDNNRRLREQAEGQATRALSLAEGLTTARERAEQATARAEQEETRVRSIINAVRDAVITINIRGIIESVNPGTEEIFGYRSHEMIGKNVSMLMPEPMRSEHDGYLSRFAEGSSTHNLSAAVEQTGLRKDGSTVETEVTLNTIMIDDEQKIIGVVKDITDRKQWEMEIKRLAMTDPLTGLANRNEYNLRLKDAITLSERSKSSFALLLLDLDKFKPVNDTYGHPIGDALLQHVSKVLISSIREVDTVARLGGDEFAVILLSIDKELNIDIPTRRIIDQLSEPISIEEHIIQIGVSIGVSIFPDNTNDAETLQIQADQALYNAKEGGRNTYRAYSSDTTLEKQGT